MIVHNALKWQWLLPYRSQVAGRKYPPKCLIPRWRIQNVTWTALIKAWRLPWVAQDPILRAPWRLTQKLYGIALMPTALLVNELANDSEQATRFSL
jgi:hypothetical protein